MLKWCVRSAQNNLVAFNEWNLKYEHFCALVYDILLSKLVAKMEKLIIHFCLYVCL